MKFNVLLRNFDLFKKIAGEGRLKAYDEMEKVLTRYFIPSDSLIDFFDGKYNIKKQIIQSILIIIIWIAPIKWLIELIVYQAYDYHGPAYYTSYFGMALGKDEMSFTILATLVICFGNYFHSFCKLTVNLNYYYCYLELRYFNGL